MGLMGEPVLPPVFPFVLLQIGSQARLMSLALRKVAANANRSGCTILFINQLRFKVGLVCILCCWGC